MQPSSPGLSASPPQVAEPTLGQLFTSFAKIGLTSFGGGVSGWILREFVHRRAWISESEFLSGLALAQSFPGVNVVNLAIWIGFRLRRGRGALVSALGMSVPPMIVAILVAAAFSAFAQSKPVHIALSGVAAAAIGLSLQTGLRAARHCARQAAPLVVMTATFAAIFLLHLPLLWVVGVMAPLSIGYAYLRLRSAGQ